MTDAERERAAVVAFIRECAEAHRGASMDAAGPTGEKNEAAFYSFDAFHRYIALAAQIEDGTHLKDPHP